MARLSIDDLNNLSGVSNSELDDVYKCFRGAHTRLYNDLRKWVETYNNYFEKLNKISATGFRNDLLVYHTARNMYYRGSQLLDSVDLFDEYTSEYASILYKLKKSDSDIRALSSLINSKKKEIVNMLSECYGLYSEAYDRLCELEDTYEG